MSRMQSEPNKVWHIDGMKVEVFLFTGAKAKKMAYIPKKDSGVHGEPFGNAVKSIAEAWFEDGRVEQVISVEGDGLVYKDILKALWDRCKGSKMTPVAKLEKVLEELHTLDNRAKKIQDVIQYLKDTPNPREILWAVSELHALAHSMHTKNPGPEEKMSYKAVKNTLLRMLPVAEYEDFAGEIFMTYGSRSLGYAEARLEDDDEQL